MDKNKKIVLISGIAVVLLMILGISFAIFRFGESSTNQELVLGDIWMKYTESNGISLENALPGNEYTNYFEFTITGTNTYTKKDIYYDISLVHGDIPAGKEESNRIEDKYLKFKLTEVNGENETEIFSDQSYDDFENKRIHISTISKSTNEYSKTYRLYMVISEELTYGNSNGAILTTEEFGKIFGSVKVNVTGSFEERALITYNDCFEITTNYNGIVEIMDYYKYGEYNYSTSSYNDNELCGSDVVIPSEVNGVKINAINYDAFQDNELTSAVIPDTITIIENGAFNNNNFPDSEAYIYARTDSNGDGIAEIDTTTSISYAGGNKNPVIPNNIIVIGTATFTGKILESVEIPDTVTIIGNTSFGQCGLTSVEIPDSVTQIENAAFFSNLLESVKLGNNIQVIGNGAFNSNRIKSIEIPSSVTSIGATAFEVNQITDVIFAENSKLTTIGHKAFLYNQIKSIEIPDSVSYIDSLAFGQNSLTNITLGNSINYIGSEAFLTHGLSYAGSNMITKVINPSGNSFNWANIFGHEATDGNTTFATGNFNFYYNGDQTIEITAN